MNNFIAVQMLHACIAYILDKPVFFFFMFGHEKMWLETRTYFKQVLQVNKGHSK